MATARQRWQHILDVADRLEPAVKREVLSAIHQLQSDLDVDALVRAVSEGRWTQLHWMNEQATFERDLQPSVSVLSEAFADAGAAAALDLVDSGARSSFRFDVFNPEAVRYGRELGAQFVTRISDETRAAIRSVVTSGFEDGNTIRESATAIRPLIGLTERQARANLGYRASLEEAGLDASRIDTLAERYAVRQLKDRALMIARTETMQYSNAGQQALWMQALEQGYLKTSTLRRWTVTPDDRACERCQAMANQLAALDRPFITPDGVRIMIPPLHPRCRCVIVLTNTR